MLSQRDILALGFVPGMTSAPLRALIGAKLDLDTVRGLAAERLARFGLRGPTIEAIADLRPYLEEAARQLDELERFGAHLVQFGQESYPPALAEIYSPPVTLFVWGTLIEADQQAIGIVGTRAMTVYGRLATERYARSAARAGVTVISGLARGIDTVAHTAALDAPGRTIAAVASGLDRITPYSAAKLCERIAGSGAVVSEYGFGVRALPAYFPQRNRIISGMSRGVLVVESDERGGAMITAGFASDQNREVFAVPGSINSPKSRGPNLLIRTDRARLTQTPEDLLDALGYHLPADPGASTDTSALELTVFERTVLDVLGTEPLHVDDVGEQARLSPSEVLVSLLGLEFKGLVRQMAGKMFLRA